MWSCWPPRPEVRIEIKLIRCKNFRLFITLLLGYYGLRHVALYCIEEGIVYLSRA